MKENPLLQEKKYCCPDCGSDEIEFGWFHSAINIHLDNGFILSPMQDDEGNGAGAMCTNIKDLQTIPVWFGGSEREV